MIRDSRIWVIQAGFCKNAVGLGTAGAWVPAIVCAIREPGMKASDVQPAGNNGKQHDMARWVESVCKHTTDAGAVLLSFPEGDTERHWLSWGFPWHATDPRTWDIWDAANCGAEGSKPLATLDANAAMKLQVFGKDGGDHPIFLRPDKFCNVVGMAGYRYNLCTVRKA